MGNSREYDGNIPRMNVVQLSGNGQFQLSSNWANDFHGIVHVGREGRFTNVTGKEPFGTLLIKNRGQNVRLLSDQKRNVVQGVEGQKNPSHAQSKRRKEKSKEKGYFCPQIDKEMDGGNVGNRL